jgi:hypothetical protein
MTGFLIFIIAVILIGLFWRVILPVLGVAAAICGIGVLIIVATTTETFLLVLLPLFLLRLFFFRCRRPATIHRITGGDTGISGLLRTTIRDLFLGRPERA